MREAFIAEDGKIFDSKEECRTHEIYINSFIVGSIEERAENIINTFETCCRKYRSDEEEQKTYRENRGYITSCDMSGIVSLRDDAVDILIERIRKLEEENVRHRHEAQRGKN